MKLINKTKNSVLAEHVEFARSFATRSKGLLGRRGLAPAHALVIQPCNSIHTFFMQFPIDVLFIHKSGKIVKIYRDMPPGRLTPVFWLSSYVAELSGGALRNVQVVEGDFVDIID